MRVRRIVAVVDSLRDIHAELTAPVKWTALRRVLDRENILIHRTAMQRRADVFCSLGVSVISISSDVPQRSWVKLAAHEYGHIKLHLADEAAGDVIVRNLQPCRKGDAREYEAELFARLLLLGPGASLDEPTLARLVRRIEQPSPAQLPLELPKDPSLRDDHLGHMLRRRRRNADRRPKLQGNPFEPLPVTDDDERLEFHRGAGGRPGVVVYTDQDGRRWAVYDASHIGRHPAGQRKTIVPVGTSYAKTRYFVSSVGETRRYIFRDHEKQDPRAMHFDRQLREAKVVRAAGTTGSMRGGPSASQASRRG